MMWQSRKALDLLRDPRIVVHSAIANKDCSEGDFKLYGRVRDAPDPQLRTAYGDTLFEQIQWRPEEPYHLFALDVEQAGFIQFAPERRAMRWTPAIGEERIKHPDD